MISIHEFIGVKQVGQKFITKNLKPRMEINASLKKKLWQHALKQNFMTSKEYVYPGTRNTNAEVTLLFLNVWQSLIAHWIFIMSTE